MAGEEIHSEINQRADRPPGVTIIAFGVLILALFSLLGFVQIIRSWAFLQSLLPFSPAVLAIFRFSWGVIGLGLTYGLWTGQRWAPNATRLASMLYTAYIWLDRMFLHARSERASNNLFVAIMILVILVFIFWTFARKRSQEFFGVRYEHRDN